MKNGRGKWKKDEHSVICNRFYGDYLNDLKHGYGEFYWESGDVYKGAYENDKRHGYGELSWTDGTIYKGEW